MSQVNRDRRRLLIFQLFLDESGLGQTGPGEAFVFAGFIGDVLVWEHFAHKWDTLLHEPPVLNAKGFKNLLRRRRDSQRVHKFVEVLKECGFYRVSATIPKKAYENAILAELPNWRSLGLDDESISLMRNEYYFGFFATIMSFLIPIVGMPDLKLEVIYDLNTHEVDKLRAGYRALLTAIPEEVGRLANEPHGETDEEFMPLQAADLLSWHMHRDFVEAEAGKGHLDSVWTSLKALDAYPELLFTEDSLREMARWGELETLLIGNRK